MALLLGFATSGDRLPAQVPRLIAGDGAPSDQAGYAVSVSGDVALVGAPFANAGVNSDPGAAYVFVRDGSGNWTQVKKLTADDGAAGDNFERTGGANQRDIDDLERAGGRRRRLSGGRQQLGTNHRERLCDARGFLVFGRNSFGAE